MNLHKQTLTLDFPRQINSSNKCPQIDEVIKKTLSKQIHQHIRETHFGHQHALIQRTKILLKTSTDRDRYSTLD